MGFKQTPKQKHDDFLKKHRKLESKINKLINDFIVDTNANVTFVSTELPARIRIVISSDNFK